ncbi:hypothetical protein [Maritimibacter sp. HL-12]|uniref:maleate cis-trans isomerase family protein n=1 Tax=Maritimibacter sp. HL-12 TaxID=1162418 RepID=UPI000A0F0B06|nr:hypothetical protein [Maritimibacter sp. HL-12]SMH53840.1 maleate isomerase [Maritimibacter sp. HL-12]
MAKDIEIDRVAPGFRETISPRAALGFIALATDRTTLRDFLDFTAGAEGVDTHPTRIAFSDTVSPETLIEMADGLEASARLLVPGQPLGSISYACTSGTIAIGEARVAAEIGKARPGVPVITPIGAARAALDRFGARRISLLMPYMMETARMVAGVFADAGYELDRVATFDLAGDPEMNRMSPEAIIAAAREVCADESEALFISCTGMRTRPVIAALEAALGRPVLTSNQVMAWGALRAAGIDDRLPGQGRLFTDH